MSLFSKLFNRKKEINKDKSTKTQYPRTSDRDYRRRNDSYTDSSSNYYGFCSGGSSHSSGDCGSSSSGGCE